MNTWNNGDRGEKVKQVIDENFKILDERTSQLTNGYTLSFEESNWVNGKISIAREEYEGENPRVDLYIETTDGYSVVCGGYEISNTGIKLQSDIPYKGKVVIR